MGIWRFYKRRMAVKVFMALAVVVGGVLSVQAWFDSRGDAEVMREQSKESAVDIARLFIGAVEHSMLAGGGLEVKTLVTGLEDRLSQQQELSRLPAVQVHIYDQRGLEVFAPKAPVPAREDLPADIRAVLDGGARHEGDDGRIYRPVPNEARCNACHDSGSTLRGVIALELDPAQCSDAREEVLPHIIAEGFTHVMTAERTHFLDDYFQELRREVPQVQGVAVFDGDGLLMFGEEFAGLSEEALRPLLQTDAQAAYLPRPEGGTLAMLPLPMEDRCTACHDDELGSIRGVLGVSLAASPNIARCVSSEYEGIVDTSLRYIMVSRLGRRIADFLDAVAATEPLRELVLYDEVGRQYWNTTHPTPLPHVAEVLERGSSIVELVEAEDGERVRAIEPLFNERACTRCHGASSPMRGAVAVSLSTEFAVRHQREALQRRLLFTGLTLLALLLVMAPLLNYLVARPVRRMGDVAERVGRGDLSAIVDHADERGDEIARLGFRINEMVGGLKAKLRLEKFVSRGAAAAADAAGERELLRAGQRREATVLFSDIRGFTAYSEQVDPESVVDMLNRLLQAQADVVGHFDGDIDKFVGDELMALFHGPNAEARAVLCATRMLEAVRRGLRENEPLGVGIGISSGIVVYGAIGHESRMDFTVIGDVVNTGARLCSAAAGDQILVTASVRDAVGDSRDLEFQATEPLSVKGKREPITVFEARRCSPGDEDASGVNRT